MQKIGIYGGSFDPIHNGHLTVAKSACLSLGLSRFFFVPSYQAPHKDKTSDVKHRLQMLDLALQAEPQFELSRFEVDLKRPVYTIETLHYFRATYSAQFYLIIGEDSLRNLNKWREYEQILALCQVAVAVRSGYKTGFDDQRALFFDSPHIDISSSSIRSRIAEKLSIKSLVPDCVEHYIVKNKLYT